MISVPNDAFLFIVSCFTETHSFHWWALYYLRRTSIIFRSIPICLFYWTKVCFHNHNNFGKQNSDIRTVLTLGTQMFILNLNTGESLWMISIWEYFISWRERKLIDNVCNSLSYLKYPCICIYVYIYVYIYIWNICLNMPVSLKKNMFHSRPLPVG